MNTLLNLFKNRRLPWLLLSLTIYFGYQHIASLNDINRRLDLDNVELSQLIDLKDQTLAVLQEQHRAHQNALITQKEAVQEAERLTRQYGRLLEKLKNENEQLRGWFNSGLPDDIERLLNRPEIKGSDNYRTWMSQRDAVLSAGERG